MQNVSYTSFLNAVRSKSIYFLRIGEEYQNLAEALLTIPKCTADLMKLIALAKETETKTLVEMEERLREEVMVYILFIVDHIDFNAVEMKQNNQTFQW